MSKKKKILIVVLAIISIIGLVISALILSSKSGNVATDYEDYTEQTSQSLPDLSNNGKSLDDIEKEWREYEESRPTIDTIDNYEWSLKVTNVEYNPDIDDLSMIVSNIIDSGEYKTFDSGFKYDFITDETTAFQGKMSWDWEGVVTNVYYILTPEMNLYIRIWKS